MNNMVKSKDFETDELKTEIRNCEIQLEERDLTGSKARFYDDIEARLIIIRKKLKEKTKNGT